MNRTEPAAVIPSPRLLAAARAFAGLSQRDLATLAGVHRTVVARYAAGARLMRTHGLEQVMVALRTCGVRFLGPTPEWDGGLVVISRAVETG